MTDEQILKAMAEMFKPINERLDRLETKLSKIEESDLAEVKQHIRKIEVAQENVTNKNIQLLFEGQKDTLNKFSQLDALAEKVEDIQTTVEVLKVLTVKK